MTYKWSHLPNAKHIDKIFASVIAYPSKWVCKGTPRDHINVSRLAYENAREVASSIVRLPMYHDALVIGGGLSAYRHYTGAPGAILALIAYDDSAHLLDSTSEEIRLLVALGHPYAILFLPAVIVFQQIDKE